MAQRTLIKLEAPRTVVVLNDSGTSVRTIIRSAPLTVIRTTGISAGGSGGGEGYVFTQSVASNTWTIPHTLGYYPNVTAIDTAGDEIEGNITYPSISQVVITYNYAVSGVAYLS